MWIFRKIRLECIQLETKFSEKQTIGQATATTSDWCPRASIVPASEHDEFFYNRSVTNILINFNSFGAWSNVVLSVVNLIFDKNAKFCGRFGMKMEPINALWTPAILGDQWIVQPKQYFNLKLTRQYFWICVLIHFQLSHFLNGRMAVSICQQTLQIFFIVPISSCRQ